MHCSVCHLFSMLCAFVTVANGACLDSTVVILTLQCCSLTECASAALESERNTSDHLLKLSRSVIMLRTGLRSLVPTRPRICLSDSEVTAANFHSGFNSILRTPPRPSNP